MRYRRLRAAGGRYFFTVVTHDRQPLLTEPAALARLRRAFAYVLTRHPFEIQAIVVLPDHLHCVWRLPDGDSDFPMRWNRVKRYFSLGIRNGGRPCWQPRFWEHLIRDEDDWRRHLDYIHYNPVKHGHCRSPAEWPHSSFRKCVSKGWYRADWGQQEPAALRGLQRE